MVIRRGGSQQARENITQTITEIPATERAELLNLIQQHHLLVGVNADDRAPIIIAVRRVPAAERVAFLDLIQQHHLLVVSDGYRASIIRKLANIPTAEERVVFLNLIRDHYLLDGVTEELTVNQMIVVVAAIPMAKRVDLLNLIRDHHLLNGITIGHYRAAIIRTVANIPTTERAARVARVATEIGVPHNDLRYFDRVILILEATADAQIPPPAALVHNAALLPDVAGQEALALQKAQMLLAYNELATNSATSGVVAKFLPAANQADAEFVNCSTQLTILLQRQMDFLQKQSDFTTNQDKQAQQFKLHNACRSLALLNGDESIEHHVISPVNSYRTNEIQGMPGIRQLFMLAYKLMAKNPIAHVQAWLAEKYGNQDVWIQFKEFFKNTEYAGVINYATLGEALQNDAAHGNKFVTALAKTLVEDAGLIVGIKPGIFKNHIFDPLVKSYTALCIEKTTPLWEALFMIMRGHNNHLEDTNEANAPACATGAHFGMLKAITEHAATNGVNIGAGLAGITIANCGDIN